MRLPQVAGAAGLGALYFGLHWDSSQLIGALVVTLFVFTVDQVRRCALRTAVSQPSASVSLPFALATLGLLVHRNGISLQAMWHLPVYGLILHRMCM